MTEQRYNQICNTYKDPVTYCYALYNDQCDENKKILDLNKFETFFRLWLKTKRVGLMQGCLTIRKNYDFKFAQ